VIFREERAVDPTKRFSNRVDNYVKYRPGYPPALVAFLRGELGLAPASTIADIGSGTGKLSEIFLDAGYAVIGVEPNDEMRAAAERLLADRPSFRSIAARAEATTLGDGSVDLVAAGQAFHWFDPEPTKREFRRILAPGGSVALVWNDRRQEGDTSLEAYEAFLNEYCPEYPATSHTDVELAALEGFFGPGNVGEARFGNSQTLDYEGLVGRILSSSYAPADGPAYVRLMEALPRFFEEHQRGGALTIVYDTKVFYGRLD
jgi:SAM-dependent methyltransferase